jgi:hypothetical protein
MPSSNQKELANRSFYENMKNFMSQSRRKNSAGEVKVRANIDGISPRKRCHPGR